MYWKAWYYRWTYPVWSALMWINRRRLLPWRWFSKALGSYTLGRSLWHPSEFPDAYRWEHFRHPLKRLPAQVILGGISHRVSEAEGLIVFSQEAGFYGTHSRICFERDAGMLWYLKFSETWDKVPMSHVLKAYRYVEAVYGKDFFPPHPTPDAAPGT